MLSCLPWFWVPVLTPAILLQAGKQAQTRWLLTEVTPPGHAGPRSSVQLCAAEEPVLFPSTKPLPRQEARRAFKAARNCIRMSGQPASLWAWAPGDQLFAGGVVRGSQGSHMPPTSWGAGHRPPQQPDAPGPVCGSRHFLQDTGPPGSSPCCPRLPLSAKVKCSRPVSARAWAALSFRPGHRGLDWTSGLPQPLQPGIRGPWTSVTRRARKSLPSDSIFGTARLASPSPPRLPKGHPRARPCQGSLGQAASAQDQGGRREGCTDEARPVGEGGQPPPLAHRMPPRLAEACSLLCGSWTYRPWQRGKPERLSFCKWKSRGPGRGGSACTLWLPLSCRRLGLAALAPTHKECGWRSEAPLSSSG